MIGALTGASALSLEHINIAESRMSLHLRRSGKYLVSGEAVHQATNDFGR
jgi:hypothetical protein